MTEIVDRICEFCGRTYRNVYKQDNFEYSLPTRFCSKSCASKQKARNGTGPIKLDPGKDVIEAEIKEFITGEDRYCTKEEICTGIGRSSKTVNKHRLKCSEINAELGYTKPASMFQTKVEEILRDAYDVVEKEKTFNGLVGTTGHPLRVDFYLPELNLAIEADGSQHHDTSHPWHRFKNGTVAEYDSIKEKFLEDNNIRLVRIPYKKRLKPEEVLSTISGV